MTSVTAFNFFDGWDASALIYGTLPIVLVVLKKDDKEIAAHLDIGKQMYLNPFRMSGAEPDSVLEHLLTEILDSVLPVSQLSARIVSLGGF